MHPSPVDTQFYSAPNAMSMVSFFKSTATTPQTIADSIFASAGRTSLREQGYIGIVMKLLLIVFDRGFFGDVFKWIAPFTPDFKKYAADLQKNK